MTLRPMARLEPGAGLGNLVQTMEEDLEGDLNGQVPSSHGRWSHSDAAQ
jgi:hypothetical protein